MILAFLATFEAWVNVTGFVAVRVERAFKKRHRNFVFNQFRHAVLPEAAMDQDYVAKGLSASSQDRLSELFVKADR